jgi:hypothetical protein
LYRGVGRGRFARGGSAGMARRIGLTAIDTPAAITSPERGPRMCPPQGVSRAGLTGEPWPRRSELEGEIFNLFLIGGMVKGQIMIIVTKVGRQEAGLRRPKRRDPPSLPWVGLGGDRTA